MTSDPAIARSIARRVARLENDRDALYELVEDFRAETRARFDRHEARLDQVDARFDQMDARFDRHEARLDQVDARFDQMDARFDQVEARFDRLEGTLAEVLRRLPDPR